MQTSIFFKKGPSTKFKHSQRRYVHNVEMIGDYFLQTFGQAKKNIFGCLIIETTMALNQVVKKNPKIPK